MKKFERLDRDTRKAEIREAAARLFLDKGFAATTMENIVDCVSLSKGGVYRIYPSTRAILTDLMLEGMRARNDFYGQRVAELAANNRPLTAQELARMVVDSLLLLPDTAALYVELLIEKRHDPALETLYRELCATTTRETLALIEANGLESSIGLDAAHVALIGHLMDTAILGLVVLDLRDDFALLRERLLPHLAEWFNGGADDVGSAPPTSDNGPKGPDQGDLT